MTSVLPHAATNNLLRLRTASNSFRHTLWTSSLWSAWIAPCNTFFCFEFCFPLKLNASLITLRMESDACNPMIMGYVYSPLMRSSASAPLAEITSVENIFLQSFWSWQYQLRNQIQSWMLSLAVTVGITYPKSDIISSISWVPVTSWPTRRNRAPVFKDAQAWYAERAELTSGCAPKPSLRQTKESSCPNIWIQVLGGCLGFLNIPWWISAKLFKSSSM